MEIDKKIWTSLNSFEISELEKLLEAVEMQEYYTSGYKHLCGGYASAEITDILFDEDEDEETGEDVDLIEFRVESGVQEGGHTETWSSNHYISRKVINDKALSIKEKLEHIKDA